MIISHKHKFIFIKSVKTAGTSIQKALSTHCSGEDIVSTMGGAANCGHDYKPLNHEGWSPHTEPHTIKQREPEAWNSYFKFCGVRNPWDLMASYWHWNLCGTSFNEFIKTGNWCPIKDYWLNGKLDFYIRFERLEEDFAKACKLIGLPETKLPHLLNFRKAPEHYSTYYTPELIELVREHYKELIEYFDYKFEKPI